MTLQSAGSISMSQIVGEHEDLYAPSGYRLSSYYSQFNGAPASGAISMSDFYSSAWRRSFVSATSVSNIGYSGSTPFGSFSDTSIGPWGGRTVDGIFTGKLGMVFRVTGQSTNAGFTSIRVTGPSYDATFNRTAGSYSYTSPTSQWSWSGATALTTSTTYYLEIRI